MAGMEALPYKISTLVFLRDRDDRILLMERNKAPNRGLWSPIGGKLEMGSGESPYEAAAREVGEEAGLAIEPGDLHLFSMIAEKNYEDRCHWLMFLFDCRKRLGTLPPPIGEGRFAFFREAEIPGLKLPETDRKALWKVYLEARSGFTALRADCRSDRELIVEIEEQMGSDGRKAAP